MATLKAANVTKYDNGGSGDNVIADGFIKTVEKVWIDSYTVTAAVLSSTSILIARIPANKKVTDIVVHCPVLGSPASNCTLYCCTGATTSTSAYFGALVLGGDSQKITFDVGTAATLRLNGLGTVRMATALAADTAIYIMVSSTSITVTGGTIRSIVRYT